MGNLTSRVDTGLYNIYKEDQTENFEENSNWEILQLVISFVFPFSVQENISLLQYTKSNLNQSTHSIFIFHPSYADFLPSVTRVSENMSNPWKRAFVKTNV